MFTTRTPMNDPVSLTARNLKPDVTRVESLLGSVGYLDLDKTDGPTGYFGHYTDQAIKRFQKDHNLKVDGLIKPGGPTYQTLQEKRTRKTPTSVAPSRKTQSRERNPYPQTTKPNPEWWRSASGKVDDATHSENARQVAAVVKTSDASPLHTYIADALNTRTGKAKSEVVNFFQQLSEKAPERAAEMAEAVREKVSEGTRLQLGTMKTEVPEEFAARMSNLEGVAPRQKPIPPGKTGADGKYQSSIAPEFLEHLHSKESLGEKNRGYKAVNRNKEGKIIAFGRYQIQVSGLEDAGFKDSKGKWTGKGGIKRDGDFLNSPEAQDRAIEDYVIAKRKHLENNGSLKKIGQTYIGIKGEKITISESGLIAAAHRIGQANVNAYLNHMQDNDWCSDFSDVSVKKLADSFKKVETRLRLFQNTPIRRKQ